GLNGANATFSVPEIRDLQTGTTRISAFGDFSTIEFTLIGFGEPRVVKAGVVGGSYFDAMGLRPVLGRLLNASDDGPKAAGAAVLTHPVLDHKFERRSGGLRENRTARDADRHDCRRAGAVGSISGRNRVDREGSD